MAAPVVGAEQRSAAQKFNDDFAAKSAAAYAKDPAVIAFNAMPPEQQEITRNNNMQAQKARDRYIATHPEVNATKIGTAPFLQALQKQQADPNGGWKLANGAPDPEQLGQLIASLRAKQQATSPSALPPLAPPVPAQAQPASLAPSIDADKMAKLKAFLAQLQGARANLPQPAAGAAGAQQDPMSQLRSLFSQMNTARMAQQQLPATADTMPSQGGMRIMNPQESLAATPYSPQQASSLPMYLPSQAPSASIMPQQISQPIPASGVNPDDSRMKYM